MISDDELCLAPWNLLRIEADGNCYSCSSAFVKDCYNFGNIFENTIDEIWNSEKAINFRRDKIDRAYKYCKRDKCHLFCGDLEQYKERNTHKSIYSQFPSLVSLSYDYTCAQQCIFCRDELQILPDDIAKKWENILESKIIPLLQNAEMLEITCAGELFNSKHSQKILKKIIEVYPKLRLRIFSNGINFTKENIDKLGIEKNLKEICISLHATNKDTYKKIFRIDKFEQVMKNIEYLSSLRNTGIITHLNLHFAINILNYKEIKEFFEICLKYNAYSVILLVNNTTNTDFVKNPKNYAIYNKCHPLYPDFIKIIQDPLVQEYIPDYIKELINSKEIINE